MGAPLFTFKMQKEVRGSTPPFLNEGNGTGGPLFTFSMKEWTMGAPLFTFSMKETVKGSAHHFKTEHFEVSRFFCFFSHLGVGVLLWGRLWTPTHFTPYSTYYSLYSAAAAMLWSAPRLLERHGFESELAPSGAPRGSSAEAPRKHRGSSAHPQLCSTLQGVVVVISSILRIL